MQKKSRVCQNIDAFSLFLAKTFKLLQMFSKLLGGEGDEKVDIVIGGRAATVDLTALFTAVGDDKALLGIGLALYGLEPTLTLAGTVAGVYIEVERPKAKGAMIARGVAEGLDLPTAMGADKAVVIFFEAFFHVLSRSKPVPPARSCCRRSGSTPFLSVR